MTEPFRFEVSLIQARGRLSFQGEVGSEKVQAALEGEPRLDQLLRADLDLAWRAGEIDFQGRVSGQWRLECSRCLAWAPFRYSVELEGTLKPEGGVVDLTDEVRQALLLAVPMRSCCKPDCKGLCPSCRGNRNEKDCGCPTI